MGPRQRTLTPRVLIQTFLFVVAVPFLPLLISRHWDWLEAWAYAIIYILGFMLSRILAARRHPDIIAERARFMQHADAKAWDKRIVPMMSLTAVAVLVVVGLDQSLGWSPSFSMPLKASSLTVLLAGYALGSYALIENRFFSGMVRIQTERGHQVVSRGPYAWIRHPGYAGALLTYVATPVLLDSSWAMIPTVLTCLLLLLRTHLEDVTLHSELPGYSAYAQGVGFRILPGIW